MIMDFKRLRERREALTRDGVPSNLMVEEVKLLACLPSEEPIDFSEMCHALRLAGLLPSKGDKLGWAALFTDLDNLEYFKYIETEKQQGRITSIVLTETGANIVRGLSEPVRRMLNIERED